MLRLTTPLAVAVSLIAAQSSAQDYSVGLGLTTFGPSIEGSYSINSAFDVRGIGFIPLSTDIDGDEVADDYTFVGKFETGAVAVLADYYPTGQGWRLSGGVFFATNDLASGTITETSTGDTFTGSLVMDNTIAPIVTGGYHHVFDNNIYLAADLGVIVSGFSAESDSTDADVIADVADINDDLDDLPVYPFLSFSVGFNF